MSNISEKLPAEQIIGNITYHSYYPLDNSDDLKWLHEHMSVILSVMDAAYVKATQLPFFGFGEVANRERNIIKKCNLIIVAKYNKEIIAVSLHNGYRLGYKAVGMAITPIPQYYDIAIKALYTIIKMHLKYWYEWIWCEASGAVAHMFEKAGAIKIPGQLAEDILKKEVKVEPDGFMYSRPINGRPMYKVLLGFNSQETFNQAKISMSDEINQFLTRINKLSLNESNLYQIAKNTLDYFNDLIESDGQYEYSEQLISIYNQNIKILEQELKEAHCPLNEIYWTGLALDEAREYITQISVLQPKTIKQLIK